MSPKITFRRGHYADPVSGRSQFSSGGVFLNPNEVLAPGELLFVVPEKAIFGDEMIYSNIPRLQKFEFLGSVRLWASLGLAALMRHFPHVVGPWQAVLPDMHSHPNFWSADYMRLLRGTQAYAYIRQGQLYVTQGCQAYKHLLVGLMVSCDDVMVAMSVIQSRSFGLASQMDAPAIPFGPDFLNHNPNTVSWISLVRSGPARRPTRTECIFYLLSYVLSESRELFNNYGPHSLQVSLSMYGFTAPDPSDELVIVATTDGAFDGHVVPPRPEHRLRCRSRIDFNTYPRPPYTCYKDYEPIRSGRFDPAGLFRLSERDAIVLFPEHEFDCMNVIDGPMWRYMEKSLTSTKVAIEGSQYALNVNVWDGVEPHLSHASAAWMVLCEIPTNTSIDIVNKILASLSSCPVHRNPYYLEELPIEPAVKNLALFTLVKACWTYGDEIVGGLNENLLKWIALRNVRIQTSTRRIERRDISAELLTLTYATVMDLLRVVVANRHIIYQDGAGELDAQTFIASRMSLGTVWRLEEIYKYRLQTAYLVYRKCRQPLEKAIRSERFITALDS